MLKNGKRTGGANSASFFVGGVLFITACGEAHTYSLEELQEKTGIEEFKAHDVRFGPEKKTVTYYYSIDSSSEYYGISFYLLDSAEDAEKYYDGQQTGYFDSLSEQAVCGPND